MKRLYEKSELTFAIVWIVIYCVPRSLEDPLNKNRYRILCKCRFVYLSGNFPP